MTDRILVLVVLVGVGFAGLVYLLGYQFLYWSFFDLDKPYLPEGEASQQVLNSITGSMNAAQVLVAGIVTAIITWKVAQRSMQAGQDAALAMPPGATPSVTVSAGPPATATVETIPPPEEEPNG